MVHLVRGDEIEIKPVEWLRKPMIPFGDVTIVQGAGGDGKTTMMITIAAMLSKGKLPPSLEDGSLHDAPETKPTSTLFLTTENKGSSVVIPKFHNAGGNRTMLFFNNELEGHITLTREELVEAIEGSDARLVIIDPLQAFLPNGTNMGNMAKMRNIMTMLTNVAEEKNCAIVIIGHLNKNEHSRSIYRGSGSVDIASAVRSILLVEPDKKNETIKYVRNIKSNFDGAEHTRIRLEYDENYRLTFREVIEEERLTQIAHASSLLRGLLQNGALPVTEVRSICQREGISPKTAQRARQRIGAVQKYNGRTALWELPTESGV